MAPTTVTPHDSWDSWNFSSMLKLRCYQVPTLSLVYSIVFLHILSTPDLCISPYSNPVLPIHVYITLLCSLSHTHILQLPAMFSDSIYKTLYHVCIRHVRVLTLIIVLIVYLTSGHSNITLSIPNSINPKLHLPYSRITLALIWPLPSPLLRLCSVLD